LVGEDNPDILAHPLSQFSAGESAMASSCIGKGTNWMGLAWVLHGDGLWHEWHGIYGRRGMTWWSSSLEWHGEALAVTWLAFRSVCGMVNKPLAGWRGVAWQ